MMASLQTHLAKIQESIKESLVRWPKIWDIKVIDLGGAVYDTESHTSVINTRQYRAPEVVL
jgi:serine/threonine protein kinase